MYHTRLKITEPVDKSNKAMWFFGFTTKNPRNYGIVGAIPLAIILYIIFRKLAIYRASRKVHSQSKKTAKVGDDKEKCKEQDWSHRSISSHDSLNRAIRTYALEELKSATKDFRIRIGVGATSYVYLADIGDGKFGAVKRVMEERGGSRKIFLDEVSVLLRISHPNLVGLLGFCMDKGEQLLLLEYVPNKSLFDRMHTHHGQHSGILSWSNRLSIALDIARALDYLHTVADPPVIHRDVKSSNILLISDDHAKLADFGLCKLGHESISSAQTPIAVKGSLGYIDINYLNTGIVSPKCDVYSFGVLLLELITGLKSTQGSTTLAEWTEECRKGGSLDAWSALLDPKLNGEANVEQARELINIADLALLDTYEERPDMAHIVDRISSCMKIDQLQSELPV